MFNYKKISKNDAILIACIISMYGYSFFYRLTELTATPFRESQTAISIYYYAVEGFKKIGLDYITPVLGSPWMVPFEFPLYQLIVYVFNPFATINSIIVASKLISFSFFLISIYVVNSIMKIYGWEFEKRKYTLYAIILSPVYVVYAPSVSIESTALLAGLLTYYFYLILSSEFSLRYLFISFVFSTACILAKSTTWVVFSVIIGLTFLHQIFQESKKIKINQKNYNDILSRISWIILILAVPFVIGIQWIAHTDEIKSANSLASSLTSRELRSWNHGNFNQWISVGFWALILSKLIILSSAPLFFSGLLRLNIHVVKINIRFYIIAISAGVFIPIILFSNLYFRHDYYLFPVTIFFVILVFFVGNFDKLRGAYFSIILCASMAISIGYLIAKKNYYSPNDMEVINLIASDVDRGPIIIVGRGFSSYIPFMTQRRALMINNVSDFSLNAKIVELNKNVDWSALVLSEPDSDQYNLLLSTLKLNFDYKYDLPGGNIVYSKNKVDSSFSSFNPRILSYIERYNLISGKYYGVVFGPVRYLNFQIFDSKSFNPRFEIVIGRNNSFFFIDLFAPIILRFGNL